MVSFTGHDGSEPVISSKSPDRERIAELPKESVPATPHVSAENNGSSVLVSGQSKAVKLRLLPSTIPGHPPIFVNEKQFERILRLRARRARVNAGISKPNFKNRHLKGSTVCSIEAKGEHGCTNAEFSQAPSSIPAIDFGGPFVATNEDEEHIDEHGCTNAGFSQAPSSIPAIDFGGPFVATNEDEEHIGEHGLTNAGFFQAPSSIPAIDFCGPFVATNEDEEHIGEDAYDNILNLKSPDVTELLKIMMEDKCNTDVTEEFKSVARLESPDFTTLLTAMNNASYDESTDDGYYCVNKVKLKLSGWL